MSKEINEKGAGQNAGQVKGSLKEREKKRWSAVLFLSPLHPLTTLTLITSFKRREGVNETKSIKCTMIPNTHTHLKHFGLADYNMLYVNTFFAPINCQSTQKLAKVANYAPKCSFIP